MNPGQIKLNKRDTKFMNTMKERYPLQGFQEQVELQMSDPHSELHSNNSDDPVTL